MQIRIQAWEIAKNVAYHILKQYQGGADENNANFRKKMPGESLSQIDNNISKICDEIYIIGKLICY